MLAAAGGIFKTLRTRDATGQRSGIGPTSPFHKYPQVNAQYLIVLSSNGSYLPHRRHGLRYRLYDCSYVFSVNVTSYETSVIAGR